MKTKNVLYAAVGAPVVLARKATDKAASLKEALDKKTSAYSRKAEAKIEELAAEGEKVVSKIEKGKVVEEIQAKVDLDQAKEQVSKLRDQLEDMLATWKTSFRPEKETEAKSETPADKPAAKTSAAKPAAKTAAKKPAAKTAAKKPAAKTTAKSTTAKTTAAKKPAAASTKN